MSHLPLDARAILEYLNELGYRNISAIQLKEFLKGMQPQSEISKGSSKHKAAKQNSTPQREQPTAATTTTATAAIAASAPHRSPIKIIKSKKPLCHFRFYLDVRDQQLTKRLEEQIRQLGGALEFFLTSEVTHFITDKSVLPTPPHNNNNNSHNNNNNNSGGSRPGTPQTPATPGTPLSLESPYDGSQHRQNGCTSNAPTPPAASAVGRRTRQSRADAILNRARGRQSQTNAGGSHSTTTGGPTGSHVSASRSAEPAITFNDIHNQQQQLPYVVWQTDYAQRFLKRIQRDLKQQLELARNRKAYAKQGQTVEPISLKGGNGFIKIEAKKLNYRPYYHLLRKPAEWPKIELVRDDGAFRLSPKQSPQRTTAGVVAAQDTGADSQKQLHQEQQQEKMTRKSRSRSSQRQAPSKKTVGGDAAGAKSSSNARAAEAGVDGGADGVACQQPKESSDKQCGVCEICKIEYDTLTIHLKTKDHEFFAKNAQNFIALDTLIHASADVNKFLDDNKKLDLEEMEVIEEDASMCDVNAPDPLDDGGISAVAGNMETLPVDELEKRRRSSSVAPKTPSPTLREKSKRSTKGKHSSEKFQKITTKKHAAAAATITPAKSPKTYVKSANNVAAFGVTSTPTTTAPQRKKPPTSASAISPPIRAKLPPSSLYKVVETPTDLGSPVRRAREVGDTTVIGSPSLIVKFKKVRQTELLRLNGEAENFMFPKQRSSSELPTDVDRQTTSENAAGRDVSNSPYSSTSLESSSSEQHSMDVEAHVKQETAAAELQVAATASASAAAVVGRRAVAIAKRRKGKAAAAVAPVGAPPLPALAKQSFPNAPIQPEVQLNHSRKSSATMAALVAATANITLPEATRKSSRTATAIVSAATTSSRLLRAAVAAAKHNSRRMASSEVPMTMATAALTANERRRCSLPTSMSVGSAAVAGAVADAAAANVTKSAGPRASLLQRRCRMAAVKLEDRMGEDDKNNSVDEDEASTDESDNDEDEEADDNRQDIAEEDEESDDELEDDDDDVDDGDDDKDADYVAGKAARNFLKQCQALATTTGKVLAPATGSRRRAAVAAVAAAATAPPQRMSSRKIASRRVDIKQEIVTEEEQEEAEAMALKHEKPRTCAQVPVKFEAQSKCAPKMSAKQRKGVAMSTKRKSSDAPSSPTKRGGAAAPNTQRMFDHTKSERLKRLRYAFERLPLGDLWYRVFARQDACEERCFEYYGTTQYRKLPYELGPIPFDRAFPVSGCCQLCNMSRTSTATEQGTMAAAAGRVTPAKPELDDDATTSTNGKQPQAKKNSPALLLSDIIGGALSEPRPQPTTAATVEATPPASLYSLKHKKLHLLQRYEQEQQLQKAAEVAATLNESSFSRAASVSNTTTTTSATTTTIHTTAMLKCDNSKATTPEPTEADVDADADIEEEARRCGRPRAGSTHSTASSCVSSSTQTTATTTTTTQDAGGKRRTYRNKHLHKAALFGLERPPRKSPREHASTLALVSCLIKQRQDSQSKPNSEVDEPPTTPTPTPTITPMLTPTLCNAPHPHTEEEEGDEEEKLAITPPTPAPSAETPPALHSPRATRSSAATPVEELRFATEISENVKRMRRGQNKYDHSPPLELSARRVTLERRMQQQQHQRQRQRKQQQQQQQLTQEEPTTPTSAKQRLQRRLPITTTPLKSHFFGAGAAAAGTSGGGAAACGGGGDAQQPSIRKTGTKKGVLEFEVDAAALRALDTAAQHTSVRQQEREIDMFLQLTGRDLELDMDVEMFQDVDMTPVTATNVLSNMKVEKPSTPMLNLNTPPPTDCFSSDFDLCDLFASSRTAAGGGGRGGSLEDELFDGNVGGSGRNRAFSLYNSVALNNYFRKRKTLKSNRTGWPKVHKKKVSVRQQQLLNQKICFLQDIKNGDACRTAIETPTAPPSTVPRRRASVVTPPNSVGENGELGKGDDEEAEGDGKLEANCTRNGEELEAVQSIPEGDDAATMDDSVEVAEEQGDEEEDEDEEEEDDGPVCVRDEQEADGDADDEPEEEEEDDEGEADDDDDDDREAGDEAEDEAGVDDEDAEDEAEEDEEEEETEDDYVPLNKRRRLCAADLVSPIEKTSTPNNNSWLSTVRSGRGGSGGGGGCSGLGADVNSSVATSTPTTHLVRGLRCTPQQLLNGSLGLGNACISPSEKAGDNSDIFTVSSDGLDTDLDLSNPHAHTHTHTHNSDDCPHHTPKRRFDLSKYAAKKSAASTCAAEAATAAVKSLAISQFLKKEVRVQCRRLRAPFRRFRYRR